MAFPWKLMHRGHQVALLRMTARLWEIADPDSKRSTTARRPLSFNSCFSLPALYVFLTGCLAKAGRCCKLQTLHQATSVGKPVQGAVVGVLSRGLEVIL